MRSILGQCSECCECPTPMVLAAIVSMSKTKVGFPGFIDSNTFFLGIEHIYRDEVRYTYSAPAISGCSSFTALGTGGGRAVDSYGSFSEDGSFSGTYSFFDYTRYINTCAQPLDILYEETSDTLALTSSGGIVGPLDGADCGTPSVTNFSKTWSYEIGPVFIGTICALCLYDQTVHSICSRSISLSNPYTTFALIEYALKSLGEYPSYVVGAPIASANLSFDERTVTLVKSKYKFRHRVPKLGSGVKYRLLWFERFSPESGADPRDAGRTYLWDGVIPGGYDPEDETTWPETPEYELSIPASEGSVGIGYLDADCNFIPNSAFALCQGDPPSAPCPVPPPNGHDITAGGALGGVGASAGAVSTGSGNLGYSPYAGAFGFSSSAGSLGFNAAGGSLGFNSSAGQLGFNSSAGQLGFNPSAGLLGFNSAAGQLGFNSSGGQLGFNDAGGQLGFNSSAGQLGFNSAAGQLGFSNAGGQLGFNPDAGQLGFNPAAGFLGFNSTLGVIGFLLAGGALGFNSSAGGLGFNASAGSLGFNSAGGGLGFNSAGGGIGTIGSL